MAVRTGLEPATSCVTGRHSNQLNYRTILLRGQDLNLRPSGYEPDELPDCSTPRQWECDTKILWWRMTGSDRRPSACKADALPAGLILHLSGDPYGIRTRVTAVKGRCLNRLTNGPILYW